MPSLLQKREIIDDMSGSQPEPSYTVFVRLPFPRGDFIDPPPVEWDDTKDKSLWKVLSKASKNSDIDWRELATRFDVSLEFLLQQAAWLYERQLVQVRAQMRKVGVSKGSTAASPIPGSTSETAGGEAMRRTGSGGGGPRLQSALSSRKDSPIPRNDGSTPHPPSRAGAPPFSRASSSNTTVQQSRHTTQTSPRPAHANLHKRSLSPLAKGRPSTITETQQHSFDAEPSSFPDSSPSDADSDAEPPLQSRILRRPGARYTANKMATSEDADDDEEGPAFMPFVAATTDTNRHHDLSATLRGDPRNIHRRTSSYRNSVDVAQQSQTSDSSASSIAVVARRPGVHEHNHRPGPLSPRRTAELARQSPGFNVKSREGSEGTPSMGSSFSDLDDASVTQSALEEALASNMQAGGGMASRMSTISQAIRSRYL
ncbi:hypothetical protein F5884DRAFT_802672 [Xylogone sp. PMI_703]|nr:hypothetical protein F5884DRAFT_802672 [Xylogone sp. PMI_703]